MAPSARVLRLALILVGVYALYLGAACGLARSVMFPIPAERPTTLPPDVDAWTLTHEEGETVALYRAGRGRSVESPGPALFFFHGNAELADDWVQPLEPYRRAGFNVLIFEYRGYGRSDGAPTEASLIADATALYDRLRTRPEVVPQQLVVHGRSLGAGVMMGLVAQREVAAVILQSTFTHLAAPAATLGIPSWALPDRFDNLERLSAYPGPSLILHGDHDDLLAPSGARELQAAAKRGRLRTTTCGHNDCSFTWVLAHVEPFLVAQQLWPSLSPEASPEEGGSR